MAASCFVAGGGGGGGGDGGGAETERVITICY